MQNGVMIELTVFGGAGAAGVLLAFVYDLFRLKRRIVRTRPLFVHIEDILYWLCAAIILFLSSYILSSGETRNYFFAGSILGSLVYFGILSRPVLWLLTAVVRLILWPFNEILRFLKPVFRVIHIRLQRIGGRVKNRAALEKYRVKVDFCRLRNTFIKK